PVALDTTAEIAEFVLRRERQNLPRSLILPHLSGYAHRHWAFHAVLDVLVSFATSSDTNSPRPNTVTLPFLPALPSRPLIRAYVKAPWVSSSSSHERVVGSVAAKTTMLAFAASLTNRALYAPPEWQVSTNTGDEERTIPTRLFNGGLAPACRSSAA